MFIKLTNFETGAAFLVDPSNFIIHSPRSKLLIDLDKKGVPEVETVMLCPWMNPNIGIRVKEDFATVEELISKSVTGADPIVSKDKGE